MLLISRSPEHCYERSLRLRSGQALHFARKAAPFRMTPGRIRGSAPMAGRPQDSRRDGGATRGTSCALSSSSVLCGFLGFLQEGTERVDADSDGAAGESVHVGGVNADDFALVVEDGSAAAAVRGGGIINQLFTNDVAEMSAGGGGANQGQGCQFTGRADVIVTVG